MSADALRVEVGVSRSRSTLTTLAGVEAKRFARHPLFLTGVALGAASVLGAGSGERGPTFLDFAVVPAFFVGILGFVVAVRLTRSIDRSREVVEGAPSSDAVRTAALCLGCLVPLTAGIALVVLHWALLAAHPPAGWYFGTYNARDVAVITGVLPAIAAIGGPLLGVTVGRWLPFPGATLLGVVVLLAWSVASSAPMQGGGSSLAARVLHLMSPYSSFATLNGGGRLPSSITSYTGSPEWYALWLLALCGLAVAAALWHDTSGRQRRVTGRAFAGLSLAALVFLLLAASGGNDRPMLTTPDGATRIATPAELR